MIKVCLPFFSLNSIIKDYLYMIFRQRFHYLLFLFKRFSAYELPENGITDNPFYRQTCPDRPGGQPRAYFYQPGLTH